MTEHVIETGLQLIDKRIQEVADKLGELAERHGGEVVDAAFIVVQLEAAQDFIYGGIAAAILALSIKICIWSVRKMQKNPYDLWELAVILSVFGIGFSSVITVTSLFNIWNWIALFEPKLVIAKRILEGVL